MRTLIDSGSLEQRSEYVRDSELESVSVSALYKALGLSSDVLFFSETQQCSKFYNGMLQNFCDFNCSVFVSLSYQPAI